MTSTLAIGLLDFPNHRHHFHSIALHIVLNSIRGTVTLDAHQFSNVVTGNAHGLSGATEHPAILADVNGGEMAAKHGQSHPQALDFSDMQSSIIAPYSALYRIEVGNGRFHVQHHILRHQGRLHLGLDRIEHAIHAFECDPAAQRPQFPAVTTQQHQAQSARHPQRRGRIHVRIAIPVTTWPKPDIKSAGHGHGVRFSGGRDAHDQCRQRGVKHMLEVPTLAHSLIVWRR